MKVFVFLQCVNYVECHDIHKSKVAILFISIDKHLDAVDLQ